MHRRIVILAKEPRPGRVKTRLIPALGPERAAALHGWMFRETLTRALRSGVAVAVSVPELLDSPWTLALRAQSVALEAQPEGDLGARMAAALRPNTDTLLLGADCPLLDPSVLAEAFDVPEPIAVGPSVDGGYWCIRVRAPSATALSALVQALFTEMAWSTPSVLAETRARCAAAGLALRELDTDYDIDEPADLQQLQHDPRLDAQGSARLRALLA